ncbi:extensin family protein [Naumannella halotolerans]|uniref:extensin family protein n=1 Tax=Naumannella halotolerans TaxID=993414 RepID=UPI00370D53A2
MPFTAPGGPQRPARWSRRAALGLGIGLGTAAVTGCSHQGDSTGQSGGTSAAYCVDRAELATRERIADVRLAYEETNEFDSVRIDGGFADQLDEWLGFFIENSGLPRPDRIRHFGTWVDGSGSDNCTSWHNSGRAIDFTRFAAGDDEFVSLRYDQWRDRDDLEQIRRRYWATAASLCRHFSYVVTYLYNDAHANHIHIDNGFSGSSMAWFSSGSQTQVQAAQAICTYLFDVEVEITGSWDRATRRATDQVLEQIGVGGSLTDDGAWTEFTGAATGRGA